MTFDGHSIKDMSNTRQEFGNEGISVSVEGEAVSNGGGKLVLWRYANYIFPLDYFAIRYNTRLVCLKIVHLS